MDARQPRLPRSRAQASGPHHRQRRRRRIDQRCHVARGTHGVQQQWGKTRWSAFPRGDNLTQKNNAGTVIVNEANRRYFEPAAGQTWLAEVSLGLGW